MLEETKPSEIDKCKSRSGASVSDEFERFLFQLILQFPTCYVIGLDCRGSTSGFLYSGSQWV